MVELMMDVPGVVRRWRAGGKSNRQRRPRFGVSAARAQTPSAEVATSGIITFRPGRRSTSREDRRDRIETGRRALPGAGLHLASS